MVNRKKVLILFGLFLLVLSISSVVYAKDALINVNNLNVRSGPSLNDEVITKVDKDEVYEVLDEQEDWVQIKVKDQTGWVSKDYINFSNIDEQAQGLEEDKLTSRAVIKYEEVNIRNGPSTSYEIIGFAKKGESYPIKNQENDWTEIEFNGKQAFIPAWGIESNNSKPKNTNIKNKTIVLDAGHGGYDVGAIGISGNYEKDYTFTTAKKIKQLLEVLGANVVLTRKTDHYYSLSGRAIISNLVNADAFISIHYNSTPQFPEVVGVGSYYYSESNQRFAEIMQWSILDSTKMKNRGVQYANFQVLRENHQPALLLELGFISNQAEESKIQSEIFQNKMANGIVSGLINYFK
ncbi:N-acetylmuramoyl-L-alanine amidase [Aquibacillus salsiterrae]|uniref:N-acetylmuramoyl-L-alanine amidase n=1 Tax=Aquibacillus salsiterrae TaxID=2950439 RepID=A0A9X4ADS7_9BACI|nr:N-acetylmuramoyl-L-alanine amidase [Aquibacillus salsiterrae]MDC3415629.1 N-acetylmuramoyl-L-alanine amidase [Aquibacillus salsiterrae]